MLNKIYIYFVEQNEKKPVIYLDDRLFICGNAQIIIITASQNAVFPLALLLEFR